MSYYKKCLIIESCEKKIDDSFKNSTVVHIRNSVILQNLLGCDLISHISHIDSVINNKYDIIICSYASPYMKYNEYMRILDNNVDAEMYWMVNDHDLEDNILLRKFVLKYNKKYNVICNNPREGYRHWILGKKLNGGKLNDWIDKWYTLDLNTLIFNYDIKPVVKTCIDTCLYFGTFRKHRVVDMLRYNDEILTISTSPRNLIKYQNAGFDKTKYVDKLSWVKDEETLNNYRYSIYFEDIHTHKNYAFMANRFYEAIMFDVIMFFDSTCIETVNKSGYHVDEYLIVNDVNELKIKINELNNDNTLYFKYLVAQFTNIHKIQNNRESVIEQLTEILM